jgi:hypothetical protein
VSIGGLSLQHGSFGVCNMAALVSSASSCMGCRC